MKKREVQTERQTDTQKADKNRQTDTQKTDRKQTENRKTDTHTEKQIEDKHTVILAVHDSQ